MGAGPLRTFGGPTLSYNPTSPSSTTGATGMSPTNVITNAGTSFPYPGATCFDSSVTGPWLQIDLASVRNITSVTVYSGGWRAAAQRGARQGMPLP